MRDLKKHEGLHPIHVDALKIIERHGWHVMGVCPRKDSDEKQEWFSYSTGLLFSYNHPEIICVDYRPELPMQSSMKLAIQLHRDGNMTWTRTIRTSLPMT